MGSLALRSLPRAAYALLLLGACEGKPIIHKLRLQKLIFLLQKEIIEPGLLSIIQGSYDFRPYNYGPFSEEVIDDIEFLKDLGLVEVAEKNGSEVYKLTNKGKQLFEKILSTFKNDAQFRKAFEKITELKKRWVKEELEKLLKYVYERYPEYTEKSMIKHLLS